MTNEPPIHTNHTIAVYPSHEEAENAVRMLAKEGFDMKNLSVIGQDYHSDEHPVGFVNTGDRVMSWGKLGVFWGAIWGLLFGSAMVIVPGIGPILFAGWIVSMIEGAVVGGSIAAIGGALASVGIPKDSVIQYETAVTAGSFLLIAHGGEEETERARALLASTPTTHLETHAS